MLLPIPKSCSICDQTFYPKALNHVYCSRNCRKAAEYRTRKSGRTSGAAVSDPTVRPLFFRFSGHDAPVNTESNLMLSALEFVEALMRAARRFCEAVNEAGKTSRVTGG